MKNQYKIGIIKDKEDLEIELTNDNIINVTGIMGSGKTTLARKLVEEKNIKLISLDWLFGASLGNRPEEIAIMQSEMEKVYPEIKDFEIFKRKGKLAAQKYYEYADKMYEYLIGYMEEPLIIEGRHIYEYVDLNCIKGKIIIKRTSLIHSYIRAYKRDMKRLINRYKEGKVDIKAVFDKFIERIKVPIANHMKANKFITECIINYNK